MASSRVGSSPTEPTNNAPIAQWIEHRSSYSIYPTETGCGVKNGERIQMAVRFRPPQLNRGFGFDSQ